MKIRETGDRRIGLSIGNVEGILTCKETVRLCLDLLQLTVDISDRVDPPTHPPLQPLELETVTIMHPAGEGDPLQGVPFVSFSGADVELSELLGEGRAIG